MRPVDRSGSLYLFDPSDLLEHFRKTTHLLGGGCEDQLVWVQVPALSRHLDASLALAGIGGIEDATALLHQRGDDPARTLEPLAVRRRRALENVGSDVVLQFRDLTEDVSEATVAIQAEQHRKGATDPHLGHQHGMLALRVDWVVVSVLARSSSKASKLRASRSAGLRAIDENLLTATR